MKVYIDTFLIILGLVLIFLIADKRDAVTRRSQIRCLELNQVKEVCDKIFNIKQ